MKRWFPILIVLAIVLAIDCLAMRYRIRTLEEKVVTYEKLIAIQDSIIQTKN